LAEAPLRKCLEIDPFNADARFNYGYMIWRRVDARQLDAMAAQWELALDCIMSHIGTVAMGTRISPMPITFTLPTKK